ncbi:MAG TPA: hypothetical protein VIL26_07275, partial [Clostridia bacterium]
GTLIGRILKKKLIKQYTSTTKDEMLLNDYSIQSTLELPLRMLAMLSNGVLTKEGALGIIDIANKKYIRGLKKLFKSNKKK